MVRPSPCKMDVHRAHVPRSEEASEEASRPATCHLPSCPFRRLCLPSCPLPLPPQSPFLPEFHSFLGAGASHFGAHAGFSACQAGFLACQSPLPFPLAAHLSLPPPFLPPPLAAHWSLPFPFPLAFPLPASCCLLVPALAPPHNFDL